MLNFGQRSAIELLLWASRVVAGRSMPRPYQEFPLAGKNPPQVLRVPPAMHRCSGNGKIDAKKIARKDSWDLFIRRSHEALRPLSLGPIVHQPCDVWGSRTQCVASSRTQRGGTAMQPDPIVWWELATQDAERSVNFFRKVFNWRLEFDERLGFHTMSEPEGGSALSGGGIFTLRKARLSFLALYIQMDDIDAKAGLVEEFGGLLIEPPFPISEHARICLFNDPSGVTWAMTQSRRHSDGTD